LADAGIDVVKIPPRCQVSVSRVSGTGEINRGDHVSSRPCHRDLADALFPGLSSLVVDEVDDSGTVLRLRARTSTPKAVCPRCGGGSRRVHAWHLRRLTDLPVAGRGLVVELQVRRLVCPVAHCPQRTSESKFPSWRCGTPGARCD
jgi:zinc-finger of transposase IS204/IS1001/IS1096/IS1165